MAARLTFDPEWRITLFTLILVPVMVSLGFWQLSRAQEKAVIAADFERKQAQPPALLSALDTRAASELAYLPVELRGSFRGGEYFLLDNRIQGGKYGNEVLAVFELAANGGLVLLNRGWVQADPARRALPWVDTPPGELVITGHVYVSPGEPYLLAEQQLPTDWPKRIQAVEMSLLESAVQGGELFPYPVRIDAGQPGALQVDWQVVNVSPEKHTGYAVQWFTMASALLIIYLLRCSNLWQLLRGKTDASE